MSDNLKEALRLVRIYTGGGCNLWQLCAKQRAGVRAHIMSALLGKKVPQSKAGINALREAIYKEAGITGSCHAHQDSNFRDMMKGMAQ